MDRDIVTDYLYDFVDDYEPSALAEAYRGMITNINYDEKEPVYVIGHKHPDSDTVSAAMSYAELLRRLGINAKAVVASHVNNETAYALKEFNVSEPEILDNVASIMKVRASRQYIEELISMNA